MAVFHAGRGCVRTDARRRRGCDGRSGLLGVGERDPTIGDFSQKVGRAFGSSEKFRLNRYPVPRRQSSKQCPHVTFATLVIRQEAPRMRLPAVGIAELHLVRLIGAAKVGRFSIKNGGYDLCLGARFRRREEHSALARGLTEKPTILLQAMISTIIASDDLRSSAYASTTRRRQKPLWAESHY
jgi:hypothetical protein